MSPKKPAARGVPHYLKIAPMAQAGSNGAAPALSYPRVEAPTLDGLEVTVKLESAPQEAELLARYHQVKRAALPYRLRGPGEALALGDELQIDTFSSRREQLLPHTFREGLWVALEPGLMMIPGLAEQVAGAHVGQKLALGVRLPADYVAEALRGQDVLVVVSVLAAKALTPLDDQSPELLARLQRGTSLDEVMRSLREELIDEKAEVALVEGRMRVLGELIERSRVGLQPAHLDAELDASWRRLEGDRLRELGFDATALEAARQAWLTDPTLRADAEFRVKASLVVAAIGERDQVQVTAQSLRTLLQQQVPGLTEAAALEALTSSDEHARELLRLGVYLATVEHIMGRAKVRYLGG